MSQVMTSRFSNVGAAGFEPTTSRSQSERAAGLRHAPIAWKSIPL